MDRSSISIVGLMVGYASRCKVSLMMGYWGCQISLEGAVAFLAPDTPPVDRIPDICLCAHAYR